MESVSAAWISGLLRFTEWLLVSHCLVTNASWSIRHHFAYCGGGSYIFDCCMGNVSLRDFSICLQTDFDAVGYKLWSLGLYGGLCSAIGFFNRHGLVALDTLGLVVFAARG